MLAEDRESEAAEYGQRSSLRKDGRSRRKAGTSSGIAKASKRKPPTNRIAKKQLGQRTKNPLSSPYNTRQNRKHDASLAEAVSAGSSSHMDDFEASDITTEDTYPDHVDEILHDAFYSGKYLRCKCSEDSGNIFPLSKYMCALRLDHRLTLHGDEAEYFFDTVFAEKDKEKPSWRIIRFQISKERDCEASEAQLTDTRAGASYPRLDDFCALLKLKLGPNCYIPLRFKSNGPNHHVLRLDVLQPDITLGCGAGIPLQKVLENSELLPTGRLILAYLVARLFWQYYQSDWMRTNWNLNTIQFLPEEDAENEDSPFNPYVPFLNLQAPDLLPTAPKEFEEEFGYVHKHPRILVLGLLLFQICSRSPYETKTSAQFSPEFVNDDCLQFRKSKNQGTWPALGLDSYYVSMYKDIVAECFPVPCSPNVQGTLLDPNLDVPAKRAMLKEKVVVPLYEMLKGINLLDQDGNIQPPAVVCKTQSEDKAREVDPEAEKWLRGVGLWLKSHVLTKIKDSIGHNPHNSVILRPKVAVIDTGYDPKSSFLTRAYKKRLQGHWKDFWGDLKDPKDDDGHGTSMLDLVLGVAPFADIYVARIAGGSSHMLNERERTSNNLAKAINWAVREQKVDVVLMSLGWDKEVMVNEKPVVSNSISETLAFRDHKVLFFAAASNFGGGKQEMFPATRRDVFSIRATNTKGYHPDFNASLSKCVPFVLGTLGCGVPTAQRGVTQVTIGRTGTSVATAITAGLVALILGYINTSRDASAWESLKTYDKMLLVLEALSEEPEAKKRFITPDKFPFSPEGLKKFDALLTMAST